MDWSDFYVVLECTGRINNGRDSAAYIKQGAKVVLISAPAKNINKTVVYNFNHKDLVQSDTIISNSSCTTKCLEPVLKVLNDALGINFGMMTTIHSYAGDQPTLDRRHDDVNRAHAAAMSIIQLQRVQLKQLEN